MCVKIVALSNAGIATCFRHKIETWIDQILTVRKEKFHLTGPLYLIVVPDKYVGEQVDVPRHILNLIPTHAIQVFPATFRPTADGRNSLEFTDCLLYGGRFIEIDRRHDLVH